MIEFEFQISGGRATEVFGVDKDKKLKIKIGIRQDGNDFSASSIAPMISVTGTSFKDVLEKFSQAYESYSG